MAHKKTPFDFTASTVADADPEDLSFGPIKPGRLYCVQWVAVEDETTGYTFLRILKTTPGADHHYLEERNPAAANLYWNDTPIYLQELETLISRLTGVTSGDVLRAYYSGWWVSTRSGHREER